MGQHVRRPCNMQAILSLINTLFISGSQADN